MLHCEFGEDRNHYRNSDVAADNANDAGAVEAGVPPAEFRNAAATAATTEFSALNLCNLCKSVAE